MAVIRPFQAVRPREAFADKVAALPYDVYSSKEARRKVKGNELSFLRIDRPETQFQEGCNLYAPCVYRKADEMLRKLEQDKVLEQDGKPCYYIYELKMNGRIQTGLVACSSVDDYISGVIRRHENTRQDKEEDRVCHVDACSAQTGPIFLAYRADPLVRGILQAEKRKAPACSFMAEDGVGHTVWVIGDDAPMEALTRAFSSISHTYIADGHHRAASAVRVSLKRRQAHGGYTGKEEFNYFLSVLFSDDELMIMSYNRVLRERNGYSPRELLSELARVCQVEEIGSEPFQPAKKGEMGFYQEDKWYRLTAKPSHCLNDPVGALDVAFLQKEILKPLFAIQDPKTDNRIDFVGGIRGLKELERRCGRDCVCAFSMYPTSIGELFAVADAGLLMPPKSTWFEPKLRSGLFIHKIER